MTELNIKKEVEAIRKQYSEDKRQDSFNMLLLGELGTGKTFIAHTCRFPVHIDSFDAGGTKGLRDYINKGDIIVDTRWEGDDPMHPKAFQEWNAETRWRLRDGYFNNFGTYILDRSTSWAEAIMNWVLLKAGIPGAAPRFTKDYTPQKTQIRNHLEELLNTPCDFILTGHLEQFADAGEGSIRYRYLTTGKGAIIIPSKFDEIYVMTPKETASGVEYRMLTQSTGMYTARSRLAKKGLLDMYEPADMKAIFKKVGRKAEDLPKL